MKKFLFFLLLTSCVVGPNYRRPLLDIPEDYMYERDDAEDTLNTKWWQKFQDPVLEDLIQEALANNKDLKIAEANIIAALGILMQVRAELFPQIGYLGEASRERLSQKTVPPLGLGVKNPANNFELLSTLSWDLDLFGRIKRLTEAAAANVIGKEEAYSFVILSLVTAVANTYIELRGLDEQLRISKRTLEAYEAAVRYFETQFQYGQVSKIVVAQSQTQYELAAAAIPEIEMQIVQVENALSILLGSNPKHIPRGKTIDELHFPDVPCSIPSQVLRNRPDIRQKEQDLIAANALIGAAIALYFPDITLTGNYGGASEQLKDLFIGPAKMWNYTGTLIGPIFTFGLIAGKVQEARGDRDATLFDYQLAIQQAFAEVENALSSYTLLKSEVAAKERLVKAAGEYEYLALLQYEGGYSPYFVVLQAEQQLFPSELSLVQTKVLLFNSLVNIYQAMGGGWVDIAEDSS